ncbi:MAG: fatty acid desaturase [Alphaproteobacteria bacterium]|nr:fatty acid desaturase [Alphaproteobacteria bacterium]
MQGASSFWQRWELPTWGLAGAIYGAWAVLTLGWATVPAWVAIPAMAWLLAWHGSFQHETIHGHPTRNRRINGAIGGIPLALWLPYELYRSSHLVHHRDEDLTIPRVDPESYYVPIDDWERATGTTKAVLTFNHTLLGRLTIGPAIALWRFLCSEFKALLRGRHLRAWLPHLLLSAVVVLWLERCGVPVWQYLIAIYLSISLTLIRSFAEHKASTEAQGRTAVIEAAWPMAILFLYNNLHARHHARPDLPWYALAAFHRSQPEWKGLAYRGYGEVLGRFLVKPVDRPIRFMDGA